MEHVWHSSQSPSCMQMIHFNFFEGNSVYCSLSSHLVCHFISASVVASSPSQSSPKSGRLNSVQKAGKEAALGSLVWADFFTLESDGSAVGPRTGFREALLRLGVAVLGSSLALGVPQSHASLPRSQNLLWMQPLDTERALPVTTSCPQCHLTCLFRELRLMTVHSRYLSGSFCFGTFRKRDQEKAWHL